MAHRARKYAVDGGFFERVDSEECTYVLGYVFADGCVQPPFHLKFASKDRSLLESVRGTMRSEHRITSRSKVVGDREYPIHEMVIGCRRIVDDLLGLGCVRRKSTADLRMPRLPLGLHRHFIRGYFDGDGGVRVDSRGNLSAHFVGSHRLLSDIRDVLEDEVGLRRVAIERHSSIGRIAYHGNWNAKRLRDYLYDGKGPWLERKREVFFSVDPRYRDRGTSYDFGARRRPTPACANS